MGWFTPTSEAIVLAPNNGGTQQGPGGDLMNDHPIGFSYSQVAALDPGIRPADLDIGWVSASDRKCNKIEEVLYKGDIFTCASCHDVHNSAAKTAGKPLLRVKSDGSMLCLTCHNK